jgi:hypothetical protein
MRHLASIRVLVVVETSFSQPVAYPLDPGTRWQFSYPPGGEGIPPAPLWILRDTILSNGKHYAAIQYIYSSTTEFERLSSDSVFACRTPFQQEHLLYRFTGNNGDTVSTFSRGGLDTTDVILQYTSTYTLFGALRRIWRFRIDVRHFIDDEKWVTIADSLGVVGISISFGYFCTLQRAIIDGRVYGIIAGVRVPEGSSTPQYALYPSFPNPFNPSTTIRYALSYRSKVSLIVVSTLGQQVAELVSGEQEAGYHEVRFEGKNLSSGFYFYRIQAGEFVQTRKLLLVR